MKRLQILLFGLSIGLSAHAIALADVKLEQNGTTVDITIDGEEFSVFNFGRDLPKPFMSPVRGPGGTVLTREIFTAPGKGDHPHHKGIWVAVDQINRIEFWAEKGKIVNRSVKLDVPRGNPARMTVVNDWQGKDGKAVVTETTTIRIHSSRLFSYDITFRAAGSEVVEFGDTKEGLFGFRMVDSMRESEGGQVVNAEGDRGTKACWGRTTDWIDYTGTVEGKTFGVSLFDHPLNFRRSRYHVRNYGLFSINPFGERAYTGGRRPAQFEYLLPGATLRLRYGLFIHSGTTKSANVEGVFQKYLKSGG
ncbi:MAG: PmoA family protein [Planctomycetaceae bacterium]